MPEAEDTLRTLCPKQKLPPNNPRAKMNRVAASMIAIAPGRVEASGDFLGFRTTAMLSQIGM